MTNQEEDLHTFQSIAQCDEESAIRWLRQCSYDLDLALRMYFESTGQEALAHPYEMLEPPILRGASSQAPRVGRRYPSVYDRTEEEDDDEEEEDDEFGGDIAADFGIVPHSSPSRSQARRSHAPESLARGDGHLSRLLQPDESYMVTDLTLRKTLELASSSGSRGILAVLVCADAFESSMLNRDIFHAESVKDVLANIFTVWYLAFDRKDLERERDSEALHFFRNYRISPDQDIHLFVLHSETGELLHTFRCNRWKRAVEIGFDPTAFLDDVMTYIEEMHRHEQPSTVHPKVSGPSESTEIAKRCREDTFFDVDAEPSLEEKLLNTAIENSLSDCGQYQWEPTFPPDKYVTEDLERGKKLSTNPIQCKIRFPRGNQVLIACNGDAPCLTIYEYIYKILIQSEELRSSQTHCVQLKLGGFPPRILSNSPEQSLVESGLTVNSLLTVIIRDNDSKEM